MEVSYALCRVEIYSILKVKVQLIIGFHNTTCTLSKTSCRYVFVMVMVVVH